jgi:heme/copper-type cytochrome/quinol oxidase subunit 2
MRAQNKWIKQYWVKNLGKFEQEEKTNLNVIQELLPVNKNSFDVNELGSTNIYNKAIFQKNVDNVNTDVILQNKTVTVNKLLSNKNNVFFSKTLRESFFDSGIDNNVLKTNLVDASNTLNNYSKTLYANDGTFNNLKYNYKTFTLHEESTRDIKNYMGKPTPLTLVKIPVSKLTEVADDNLFMFKFRYNDKNSTLASKNGPKVPYFAFKQQRYKARKLIPMVAKKYTDDLGNEKVAKNNFTLNNQYSVETDLENPTRHYRMLRKNKVRSETMPIVVSKRLLRVKKTLVLPTHINITAVTNSYDVVHSWFIPGLGLKMDCVPGRSTHHTFYIDNAGFYYGQCAEICGRYHHHMPIRVCALPFEHFLVW